MRKLVKTFSYIIAAIMVICLLPAKNALAARGRVALGETKYSTADSYEMTVGETKDLNFYGAKGYIYKTDSGSVFWKTTNSGIVSVDKKGLITAVAPGTAIVSMTVTVASTRTSYEGSVTVNVKGKQSGNTENGQQISDNVDFALVAFDRAVLRYATADQASEALKKGISLKRVRKFNTGAKIYTTVIPRLSIDNENKNIINIDTTFTNGALYLITAEGLNKNGAEVTVSWDTQAAYAELTYENAFLSESGGLDITGKKTLSYCDATPRFELYDENNIVIGRAVDGGSFIGASGVSGKLRYVLRNSGSGNASLRSTGSGIVRISKLSQTPTVYATWTSDDNKTVISTRDCTIVPQQYVAPDLGGIAEGIVVTNATGNDVDWSGSEFWQASMPATTSANVLFYFLGSDGRKYSPSSLAHTADDIYPLNTTEYRFIYLLDQDSEKIASLNRTSGKLTAYDEGDIVINIWLCEKGKTFWTDYAQLVGQLNVSITEEPSFDWVEFEEYVMSVDHSDNLSSLRVKFDLQDQYGELFKIEEGKKSNFIVRAAETSYSSTYSSIVWRSDRTGGEIVINLGGKPAGSYTYNVKYGNIIDEQFEIIVY